MKTQTEKILDILRIIAWIGYVGSLIALGIILVTLFFSFLNPDGSIPVKLNISGTNISMAIMRKKYLFQFLAYVSLIITEMLFIIKIWELSKNALSIINLKNPFSFKISKILEKIGYLMFSLWIIGVIGGSYSKYLEKLIGNNISFSLTTEFSFLFGAGLIYLISQIFKRGVEIQEENELTV